MNITCEFCGDVFISYDDIRRKYCDRCRDNKQRISQQFRETREQNPVVDIYTKHYNKRLVSCKRGKISREVLEDWRLKAKKKRYDVSVGAVTVEDFAKWCEQTYECLFNNEIRGALDESHEIQSFSCEAADAEGNHLTLTLTCELCGEDYAVHDSRERKYCPKCQNSGKRYSQLYRQRCERSPIIHIYSKHYKKRAGACRAGKISRDALEDWRLKAKLKQHEVSTGDITLDDFKEWCEQTYKSLRNK